MEWTATTGGPGTRLARLDGGGRLQVPFSARFVDQGLEFELTIDVADGRPICTEYTVRRTAKRGPGLEGRTTDVMRGVRLRDLMIVSCARAAETSPGTPNGKRFATSLDALEAVVGPIRRQRRPITDELLNQVAAAFQERYVPGRMDEFAESMNYSGRQMWRLVKLARQRGFLPGDEEPDDRPPPSAAQQQQAIDDWRRRHGKEHA